MRLLAFVAVLLVGSLAVAANDDKALPIVSDAVLAVALSHRVEIRLGDGYAVVGLLASWDERHVVVVVDDGTRRIVELRRLDLAEVRLADLAPRAGPRLPPVTAAEPPPRERHLGLQGALGPGNLVLDLQVGHFYGFAATSIGYPIIFSTSQVASTGRYFSFAVGVGPSFKLSPQSRWRFDIFAMVTPTWWGQFSAGIGVGVGFHYTASNGLTLGFKLPVMGAAPGCGGPYGGYGDDDAFECAKVQGGVPLILNFFTQAAMQLPIVSFGYRF